MKPKEFREWKPKPKYFPSKFVGYATPYATVIIYLFQSNSKLTGDKFDKCMHLHIHMWWFLAWSTTTCTSSVPVCGVWKKYNWKYNKHYTQKSAKQSKKLICVIYIRRDIVVTIKDFPYFIVFLYCGACHLARTVPTLSLYTNWMNLWSSRMKSKQNAQKWQSHRMNQTLFVRQRVSSLFRSQHRRRIEIWNLKNMVHIQANQTKPNQRK